MRMNFCSNISFMFTEYPFLKRYDLARKNGFRAIESGFPLDISLDDVVKAKEKANIEQVLLNVFTGDTTKGELGFAAIPNKKQEFLESLEQTIKYAKALNCKKIHIMSGKVQEKAKENFDVYLSNLQLAEEKLRHANIVGVIEPINGFTVPNYYLDSYKTALDVIRKINSPHIRLMVDIFHLQQITGNIYRNLTDFAPYIGHVQIAQVPYRGEPNSSGELHFPFVFKILKDIGYQDWIGLEYKPEVETVPGLKWITDFGYNL